MKTKLLLPLLAALAVGPTSLHAQTAFTYQGKLVDDCCPATGLYDLTFKMFDSAGPGTAGQQGSTWALTGVPVTNGLFTVSLDFGSAPFNGARRWLQIDARSNNVVLPFVTLTPRTELTPTPYAVFAGKAGSVTNGAIQPGQLGTPVAPSPGQVLGYNGSSLVWQAPGGGSGPWLLNGNNAYYNGGNVGIGTDTPRTRLELQSPLEGEVLRLGYSGVDYHSVSVGYHGGRPEQNYVGFDIERTSSDVRRVMTLRGDGNVGIGTTTPQAPLHVVNGAAEGIRIQGTASGAANYSYMSFYDSAGTRIGAVGDGSSSDRTVFLISDAGDVTLATAAGRVLTATASGNVGIGTTSPDTALHVMNPTGFGLAGIHVEQPASFDFARLRMGVTSFPYWDISVSAGANPDMYFVSGGNYQMVLRGNGNAEVRGTTTTCALTITGGCDLSEPFHMSSTNIPKGAIVTIDKKHAGQLKLSTHGHKYDDG